MAKKYDAGPDNRYNVFQDGKTPQQAALDACPLHRVVALVRHAVKVERRADRDRGGNARSIREKDVGAYLTLRLACEHEVTLLQDGVPDLVVDNARAQVAKGVWIRCPVCGPSGQ